jgi:hypothetical protein
MLLLIQDDTRQPPRHGNLRHSMYCSFQSNAGVTRHCQLNGGEEGIRTLVGRKPSTDFESPPTYYIFIDYSYLHIIP